jgi:FKBP-type peptidyl-prolyl cis-trans isomerase FklB
MRVARAIPQVATSAILIALLVAIGCAKERAQDGAKQAASAPATASAAATAEPNIESRKDKLSYAFGVDMARTIQREKDSLNVELLRRALFDTLAGQKLAMSDEEVAATLEVFEKDLNKDLAHANRMIAARNRKEGEAFLAENAKKPGVVSLPGGLQYKVLRAGDGKRPALDDRVVCNFRSTLLDGKEIDSSDKRKQPAVLPIKSVIPGLSQALQLMPVGSKWQLYIPAQLAYGDRAMPALGANSTLLFDVELVAIADEDVHAAR